jgi:hypothetical protein
MSIFQVVNVALQIALKRELEAYLCPGIRAYHDGFAGVHAAQIV